VNLAYPTGFTFRRKGLPKRMMRLPGGVPGMVSACNIHVADESYPAAKVVFFKDRVSMRRFNETQLPRYRGTEGMFLPKLGRKCAGFVNKLAVEQIDLDTCEKGVAEVDRRYFCIVCLVEGDLTAEILGHEANHVGFAWDYRTRGKGPFADVHNPEENVCYPAGIFLDQVLTHIKREGLREI
jgi:hypothetical protein